MNRNNILAVRLTDEERREAEALAAREKLPLSTLVRRNLLLQAEAIARSSATATNMQMVQAGM